MMPIVNTIPKSGTHLLLKLFYSVQPTKTVYWNFIGQFAVDATRDALNVTEIKPIEATPEVMQQFDQVMQTYGENRLICSHAKTLPLCLDYLERYPEQKIVLQVRDLRDVLISLLFSFQASSMLHKTRDPSEINVGERLKELIRGENIPPKIFNIHLHATEMVNFIKKANPNQVYISRFEKLVGNQGGGDDQVQFEEIQNLMAFCNIPCEVDTHEVAKNLFGAADTRHLAQHEHFTMVVKPKATIDMTYREGKVGSWKKYFTEEHLRDFENRFGALQTALGY